MGSIERQPPFAPLARDIAIVGAGPCGLVAAKYLEAQGCFGDIVVYEQQPEVGGVWNYSKEPTTTLHVPQLSPFCPTDPPRRDLGDVPVFPSPMYDLLHTNILHDLMDFSDLPFKKDALIFPSREDVQEHILKYAKDVRHLVNFSTQVTDIKLRQEGGKDRWDVETTSVLTGETSTRTFDAVVVASGHYATTYLPDIQGLAAFHRSHPGMIIHAKQYRTPEVYRGKKVVVVGNSASGVDIASQISKVSARPLLLSVRNATQADALEHADAEEIAEIAEFLPEQRGIRLVDGRVETDIDHFVFATGYLYAFPFMKDVGGKPLVTNGRRVFDMWKDFLHIEHPTIAFPGLPMKAVPFAVAESQAAIFARLWAGELDVPSKVEMRRWVADVAMKRAARPDGVFHALPALGDAAFINETYRWVVGSGSRGKTPPFWDEQMVWQRTVYRDAKMAFEKKGRTAMTLEELGFRFEPVEAVVPVENGHQL